MPADRVDDVIAPSGAIVWSDVLVASLLALVVTSIGLTAKSIWLDEAVSIGFARSGGRELLSAFRGGDPNMLLYYVGLNVWRRLFGDSPLAMRIPGVIAASLSAGVLTVLGQRLFSRDVGRLAGGLLAFHALLLWYAQTARSYVFVLLVASLCMLAFVAELARPSRRALVAWVATGAALVYLHFLGALLLVAQGVYALLLGARPLRDRRRILAAIVLVLLCVPAAFAAKGGGTARIDWVPRLSWSSVQWVLTMHGSRSALLFGAFLSLGAWGALRAWRREARSAATGDATSFASLRVESPRLLVACWLVVPLVATFAVSFVRPLFLPHYVIAAVPGLVLWASSALTEIASGRGRVGLAVLLVALELPGWWWVQREGFHEDWASASRVLLRDAATFDGSGRSVIVTSPRYASQPLNYYLRRAGRGEPAVGDESLELASPARVWYAIRIEDYDTHHRAIDSTHARLARTHRRRAEHHFPGVTLELYER